MSDFCLVMGQINPIVGDVSGNVNKIIASAEQARDEFNADLVVFPELTLTYTHSYLGVKSYVSLFCAWS